MAAIPGGCGARSARLRAGAVLAGRREASVSCQGNRCAAGRGRGSVGCMDFALRANPANANRNNNAGNNRARTMRGRDQA